MLKSFKAIKGSALKIVAALLVLSFSCAVLGETKCFLAQEGHQVIERRGDCKTRRSPCSTFKIAISLMGYDAGILENTARPEWEFKKGYDDFLESWKQPQTPITWMKNSCVWYSQVLTQKLGMQKFETYIQQFQYGNMDCSGDKGKKQRTNKLVAV